MIRNLLSRASLEEITALAQSTGSVILTAHILDTDERTLRYLLNREFTGWEHVEGVMDRRLKRCHEEIPERPPSDHIEVLRMHHAGSSPAEIQEATGIEPYEQRELLKHYGLKRRPEARELLPIYPDEKPKTRGECHEMSRPCPFVSCRYHLLGDQVEARARRFSKSGPPKYSEDEIADMIVNAQETCALDVAESPSNTLRTVGEAMSLSPEAVRQFVTSAVERAAYEVDAESAREVAEFVENANPSTTQKW